MHNTMREKDDVHGGESTYLLSMEMPLISDSIVPFIVYTLLVAAGGVRWKSQTFDKRCIFIKES